MPAFAFNIYPKGFGKQIQLQDAYRVGRDIVEQFRIRIRQFPEFKYLTGQEEGFSILLYSGGRVKIEIESSISSLKKDDLKKKIKNFLHLDYPCGKTTGYYAKVMLLRSTGNFLYTLHGHPVASHREFSS